MRERFDTLQALRGAACLLVVVYHTAWQEAKFGLGFAPLRPVQWFGYAGVDLFFVLSGFIIAATTRGDLGQPRKLPAYLFRRGWRIYPTYWVVLGLALAHHAVTCPDPVIGPRGQWELAENALLLPQDGVSRFVSVAWTLSYELMFYLAVGLLFVLPRGAVGPAAFAWGGVVAWRAATAPPTTDPYLALPASPFVLEFLAGFLLGCRPPRLTRRGTAAVLTAAAGWCAFWLLAFHDPDPHRLANDHARRVLTFGPAAALAVLACTGWERGGGRCGFRRLRQLGDASYAVYLVHTTALLVGLYLTLLVGVRHNIVGHLLWIGFMLTAAIGPGLLLYRYVEHPLLNLARRRPTGAVVTPTAPVPLRRAA